MRTNMAQATLNQPPLGFFSNHVEENDWAEHPILRRMNGPVRALMSGPDRPKEAHHGNDGMDDEPYWHVDDDALRRIDVFQWFLLHALRLRLRAWAVRF